MCIFNMHYCSIYVNIVEILVFFMLFIPSKKEKKAG